MNVLDLFSGIGGFSLGLERAGMHTVAFCEIEPYCRAVLRKHWPSVPIFNNIKLLRKRKTGYGLVYGEENQPTDWFTERINLICGGFPCQPTSTAGKRMGAEDHRWLWPEYRRIVEELSPDWVLGENTIGLVSMELDNVLADLEALGYATRTFDIPACAVGAFHERRRTWIVANAKRVGLQGKRPGPEPRNQALDDAGSEAGGTTVAIDADTISGEQTLSGALGRMGGQELVSRNGRWKIASEPFVRRGIHGIPRRMDRIRALGNAVVPQIPEIIGRAIMQAEGLV